jgi:HD-GYP domain-containing protein (c-di-GMP phosphodiesterase class II)
MTRTSLYLLAVAVAALAVMAFVGLTDLGNPARELLAMNVVYSSLLVGSGLACVLRAVWRPTARAAWALIGVGLLFWAAADIYYQVVLQSQESPPYPSFSDALYIAFYLCELAGFLLLAHAQRLKRGSGLELAVVAAGLATVWWWVVFASIVDSTAGVLMSDLVTLAYPVLDLLPALVILGVMLRNSRSAGHDWSLAGGGFAVVLLADCIFLHKTSGAGYVPGRILDVLWPSGAVLIALAAWVPAGRDVPRRTSAVVSPVMISVASGVALAALLVDHWHRVGMPTIAFATTTLVLATLRAGIGYRHRVAAETRATEAAVGAVSALAAAVDAKDEYTRHHSDRVAMYATAIAIKLGWKMSEVEPLMIAGRLHDVGKIALPDEILLKPGKLTDAEYEQIKQHSAEGEKIVHAVGRDDIAAWIRHHHERWDGRGYPDGLRAREICLESRILAVADAFDAMTSARSYQTALDFGDASAEIARNAGTQFDPELSQVLVDLLRVGVLTMEDTTPRYTVTDAANGHLTVYDHTRLSDLLSTLVPAKRPTALASPSRRGRA